LSPAAKTGAVMQSEGARRAKPLTWASLNDKPVSGTGGEGNHSSWLAQRDKVAQHLLLNVGVIYQAYRAEPASPSPVEMAKSLLTSMETCWFAPCLPLTQFYSCSS